MSADGSLKVILGSLAANVGIALAKGAAAFFTGSGSMLAESIHSAADCANQLLLLVGSRQAKKPATEQHPMGRGRSAYFWSFLVALLIFCGGGVFSIYEGVHKLSHPEPVERVWVALIVLSVALVLEGLAAYQAARELNKKRGEYSFFRFLDATKDVDLVVLFAENAAAVIGLTLALIALGLAQITGDADFDAYGSIAIGALLCLVAYWLAAKVKSLLEGEAADPVLQRAFEEEVQGDPKIQSVLRFFTIQQGPEQVMLAAKIKMVEGLPTLELVEAINDLERRMRARHPEIRWQFVEPDIKD